MTSIPDPSKWHGHHLLYGRRHYGLTDDAAPPQLRHELKQLKRVALHPNPDLHSPFETCPLAHSTLDRHLKDIKRFLGFAVNVCKPALTPSLSLYFDTNTLFNYLSWLQARGTSNVELSTQLKTAGQVQKYLMLMDEHRGLHASRPAVSEAERARRIKAHSMAKDMRARLKARGLKLAGSTVPQVEVMPDVSDFILWEEEFGTRVHLDASAWVAAHPNSIMPLSLAAMLRDAVALTLGCGGFVSLHTRGCMMWTMQAPHTTECHHPDCLHSSSGARAGCRGNRLDVNVPTPSASLTSSSSHTTTGSGGGLEGGEGGVPSTATFSMLLPHHKNSWRGIAGVSASIPVGSLPHKLLPLYLQHGRPALVAMSEAAEEPVMLLLTKSGQPYDSSSWCDWFTALQAREHAPTPHLTYHHLRHMFASDRLLNPDIPGPSNEAAAMLMNNTPKQWKKVYAPNARIATAAAGVSDAYHLYRPAHLAKAKSGKRQRGDYEDV